MRESLFLKLSESLYTEGTHADVEMNKWILHNRCPLKDISLTLLPSSWSSSLMELEGDGVADLLVGGDGAVWAMLGPAMFKLSCALSWDWFMVVS